VKWLAAAGGALFVVLATANGGGYRYGHVGSGVLHPGRRPRPPADTD
jgi:hypothetical protein